MSVQGIFAGLQERNRSWTNSDSIMKWCPMTSQEIVCSLFLRMSGIIERMCRKTHPLSSNLELVAY